MILPRLGLLIHDDRITVEGATDELNSTYGLWVDAFNHSLVSTIQARSRDLLHALNNYVLMVVKCQNADKQKLLSPNFAELENFTLNDLLELLECSPQAIVAFVKNPNDTNELLGIDGEYLLRLFSILENNVGYRNRVLNSTLDEDLKKLGVPSAFGIRDLAVRDLSKFLGEA